MTAPSPRASQRLAQVTVLGVAAVALLAALSGPVQARERHTSVTGAQGRTATRDVSRVQGDVSSTTTGPRGRTASRQVERSADGTEATVTGPNGQTASRSTTRTDGGSSTTVTGPEGQSGTVTVQRSR
ncbi:hypothetical protein [Aquabacterium sp. OR-4]|uniref:hypothetical protein n=1 Tax=Aquabacterium sp. OR-4 TaxID=2978127 RepID=UPI0021B46455|nr:hypothetical protein [Aquabacterium sp. OR-4]MDT7837506.1 hypothetical protein [Aquabacterium sp. OR-4]